MRPVTKKNRERFEKLMREMLLRVCGVVWPDKGNVTIQTKYGPLELRGFSADSMYTFFTCFMDPSKLPGEQVPYQFRTPESHQTYAEDGEIGGVEFSGYSGKWNFHMTREATAEYVATRIERCFEKLEVTKPVADGLFNVKTNQPIENIVRALINKEGEVIRRVGEEKWKHPYVEQGILEMTINVLKRVAVKAKVEDAVRQERREMLKLKKALGNSGYSKSWYLATERIASLAVWLINHEQESNSALGALITNLEARV